MTGLENLPGTNALAFLKQEKSFIASPLDGSSEGKIMSTHSGENYFAQSLTR
jgi:hypothetical protein